MYNQRRRPAPVTCNPARRILSFRMRLFRTGAWPLGPAPASPTNGNDNIPSLKKMLKSDVWPTCPSSSRFRTPILRPCVDKRKLVIQPVPPPAPVRISTVFSVTSSSPPPFPHCGGPKRSTKSERTKKNKHLSEQKWAKSTCVRGQCAARPRAAAGLCQQLVAVPTDSSRRAAAPPTSWSITQWAACCLM